MPPIRTSDTATSKGKADAKYLTLTGEEVQEKKRSKKGPKKIYGSLKRFTSKVMRHSKQESSKYQPEEPKTNDTTTHEASNSQSTKKLRSRKDKHLKLEEAKSKDTTEHEASNSEPRTKLKLRKDKVKHEASYYNIFRKRKISKNSNRK